MNAFTRSAAGLNNIRHFYNAQFNLYIEGKKPAPQPNQQKQPTSIFTQIF